MNEFIIWSLVVAGSYNIVVGLWLNTKNFRSAMVFKIVPFFIGCATLFAAGKLSGVI